MTDVCLQLVSSFQLDAQNRQTESEQAKQKLSSLRRMIARLLKSINDVSHAAPHLALAHCLSVSVCLSAHIATSPNKLMWPRLGCLEWLGGVVVSVLNLHLTGHRLPTTVLLGSDPGQVVHTHTCASVIEQYNLVLVCWWWWPAAGRVTVGVASHGPCVTIVVSPRELKAFQWRSLCSQ